MKTKLLLIALTLFAGVSFGQSPGNCLHFNGVNNNVSTALPTVFNNVAANDLTIEAWVYPEGNVFSRIVFAQFTTSSFVSLSIATGNSIYFYVNNTASQTTNAGLPANQWTHVACTWDASTQQIQIFFNGIPQATTAGGSSSTGSDNLMTIGSRTNNAQYFPGRIDEVRIWDDIRTPCEIQSSYTTEYTATQPNMVAYYKFNEGTAGGTNTGITTLPDLTTNYNGTLNGFGLSGTTSNWISSGATISTLNQTSGVVNGVDTQTSCGPITWIDGNNYTSSNNTATYLLSNGSVNGCDSLVTLDFTLLTPSTGVDVQSSCSPITWLDGNTYSADENAATYAIPGGATNGCDSVVTLNFTLLTASTGVDVQSSCTPITWLDGNTYSADENAATYAILGGAANGCDSIVTLNFTLLSASTGIDVQSSCGSYTWIDGNTYTTDENTATYTFTGGAANGCDSIVTLNLTVNSVDVTTSVSNNVLSANTAGATYQWLDCDNGYSVISGETNATFTPTSNGNYAVAITENSCTDTSACTAITTIGIVENFWGADFTVYPNPTNGLIEIQFSEFQGAISIELYSLEGKLVQSTTSKSTSFELMIEQPAGVYLLKLSNELGNTSTIQVIKK